MEDVEDATENENMNRNLHVKKISIKQENPIN